MIDMAIKGRAHRIKRGKPALTENDVRDIRDRYNTNKNTAKELSEIFDVSRSTVLDIAKKALELGTR